VRVKTGEKKRDLHILIPRAEDTESQANLLTTAYCAWCFNCYQEFTCCVMLHTQAQTNGIHFLSNQLLLTLTVLLLAGCAQCICQYFGFPGAILTLFALNGQVAPMG